MKVTVLTDNISIDSLQSEWGLSFFIEYGDRKILLDTGGSDRFIRNAAALGIDISDVDFAVLSHAHYDHSLGMRPFFQLNAKAPFYLSPDAQENCYSGWKFLGHYIGLPKGILAEFSSRIVRPSGVCEISKGVYLVPHSTQNLAAAGKKSNMYVRKGWRYIPDDFSHEQSLVIREDDGLVIFNSCSHAGPDVIIDEVRKAFPGESIKAYLGGLHLFRLKEDEVRGVAARIKGSGLSKLYTGHCTGDKAFLILKELLGDSVEQFYCGMQVSL